jgi:hypothetical protein
MTSLVSNGINLLVAVLISLLTLSFFIAVIYGSLQPTFSPSVSLESKNFTTNNTFYTIGYTPTNNDLHLYYFGNTTFEIISSRFSVNTTHIKIYGNETAGCSYPDVCAGSIYYYSYTYQRPFVLNGVNFGNWLPWIAFIIITFVALAIFFYIIKINK